MIYTQLAKERMERGLPPADETRRKADAYRRASGMTHPQFAELVGYAQTGIKYFISGRYLERAGTDLAIRSALEKAMALHPLDSDSGPESGRLYETENVAEMRRWLEHCHANRSIAILYGPPGSQKTYTLKHLIAEFNRRELKNGPRNRAYYVRASVNMPPREMVRRICMETGSVSGLTLSNCIAGLRVHLRAINAVIVIDEAQGLPIATLEALRELHDERPRVGLLLAGSHGLKQIFDQRAAELEQWNSRIDMAVELPGVSEKKAIEILAAELPTLSKPTIAAVIESCRVADIHSRVKGRTYLSIRRLFKTIGEHPTKQKKERAA